MHTLCCSTLKITGEHDHEFGQHNYNFIDYITYPRNGKTLYGSPKWFGYGPNNRIKLILDCDKNTLEFRLLKEEKNFWKVRLPENQKNLRYYPVVWLRDMGMSATFVGVGV